MANCVQHTAKKPGITQDWKKKNNLRILAVTIFQNLDTSPQDHTIF